MHGLYTLAHTHSNLIISTIMQAIDKALKDLASQESLNYSATARKHGIYRTTLLRRYRGLARSWAVLRHWQNGSYGRRKGHVILT